MQRKRIRERFSCYVCTWSPEITGPVFFCFNYFALIKLFKKKIYLYRGALSMEFNRRKGEGSLCYSVAISDRQSLKI